MIPIADNKKPDWNKIKNEYICGNISQRKLAAKYGISYATLRGRAESEQWPRLREEYQRKASAEATQKSACAVADNAVIAADVKRSLLLRLQRIERKYPFDATEVRTQEGKNTVVFKLRDLTAAYKDLTEGKASETENSALDKLDHLLEVAINAAYTETS